MADVLIAETEIGPSIDAVLADPTASFALKAALRLWADRDPVDAAHDALILFHVLEAVADRRLAALGSGGPS